MEAVVEVKPLSFFSKVRLFLACVLAVILMRTAGWHVAQPIDPDLGVTLLAGRQGLMSLGSTLLVLTAVAAIIGTVIVGRRLPEGGIFAAGIGLAALALRGGSMQMELAYECTIDPASRRALMMKMALDCILWALIMAAAWVAVVVVRRWLWAENPNQESPAPAVVEDTSPKPNKTPAPRSKSGWPALMVTVLVAVFVIWMTICRTPVAEIVRGQIIASVAGGFFVGALAARYFTNIHDSHWYALAVPAVALIGYLLGYLSADMSWAQGGRYQYFAELSTTPPHALVRALPVEYLAVGVSAALSGFWCGEKVEHVTE